ncbi:cilia- and flagella-associated protein 54 [Discoglossus pictus]
MEPLPAAFYGELDHKNPVIATCESEIRQLLGYMRKVQKAPPTDSHHQDYRRGSSTLFNIWVKYKLRLPASYYQEKLLKVGDSLVQIKEYRLALFQCYGRYLEQFCSEDIDDITDVNQFKSIFFPNGTDDKMAGMTFHALQGRCICIYQLVKTSNGNRCNEESVNKCLKILSFLQLIMQVVLPQEHLCWLIYNGTLHIYTICRHLMALGHSSKALEFLLWASVCMESSVPLLSLAYLTWRATLYTAVCQCYFDCRAGVHGEVFARRALSKINELSQLENMSDSSNSEEAKQAFREATCKMAIMIFKRAVFESRRKPKGMLRPKIKTNLKDLEKLQWPRTNTEKLLVEMFGNGAAQFLAILEALSDSNRRVIQAGPPFPDEPEIYDVIGELFFAGIDILSGGGYKAERGAQSNPQNELFKLLKQSSLLELAVEEKNAVSAEAVVKFAKLAFSYEQWDAFDSIIAPLYTFIQSEDKTKWKNEEMDLKILIAAEPLLSGKRHKHGLQVHERSNEFIESLGSLGIIEFQGESLEDRPLDDHVILAETLFSCVCNTLQDFRPDRDIVVDVILFLWQKCKTVVQRLHASDLSRFVQKCDMTSKWIYILCLMCEVMQRCNIMDTDAVIMGEAALRLAGISESMADSVEKYGKKTDKSLERANEDSFTKMQSSTKLVQLKKNPVTLLFFAYETLEKAIKGMSLARSVGDIQDEASVTDPYCMTLGVKKQHLKHTNGEQNSSCKSLANTVMMMDLQLELIVAQHRVSVKLLFVLKGEDTQLSSSKNYLQSKGNREAVCFPTESDVLAKINKNKLSNAIFLMQKALVIHKGVGKAFTNKVMEDAEKLIQKAEMEENAVYLSCVKESEESKIGKKNPPPPILLCRTENAMVFKPAPFKSSVKVSWYCIYAQCATGPNLKVRLNDHHLPGTGEKVPASSSNLLEVKGLVTNEKYIFAVAAYSADGNLIGDTIGESTKPILAFPPLSVPATWAYLAQTAYQMGNYRVAKQAVSVLWNYFVLPPISSPTDDVIISENDKLFIAPYSLCPDVITKSSPILLQLFLGSIFIWSDINIKEGALFCDAVCDNGVLLKWQVCRIAECERLLVALDLSTWLSDFNYALQAVVQCYGLIVPIIYHKIPSIPVVQISIKCLTILQEIPSTTWQKKQTYVTEGMLHMIACMTYYVAKVLRSWQEYELALAIIEVGKRLLNTEESTTSTTQPPQFKPTGINETNKAKDIGEKDKGISPRKDQRKKSLVAEKVTEQLSALEQTMLKMTNPSCGIQLTGKEDPLLLYSVVTCWPPVTAYKEVMKFKMRPRFLEFFVQLLQRVVSEENFKLAMEWTSAVFDFLKRRDGAVLGRIEETGDVAEANDSYKRYTAGLVEYQKDGKQSKMKQPNKQAISTENNESVKRQQKKQKGDLKQAKPRTSGEDPLNAAFIALVSKLTPLVSRYMKHKRHNETCSEEMPWRSQMNLLLALTQFSLLRKKLGQQRSEELAQTQAMSSYRILDPELFSLHHAGTVVMATETNAKDERIASPGHLHPSVKLDIPPETTQNVLDLHDLSGQSTKRSDADTPRTQRTNDTETSLPPSPQQVKQSMSSSILLGHLGKIFSQLKRALVLAHRGGHWTLLQNTCRVLWNLTLELQLIIKEADVTSESFPITKYVLNSEIWMCFYLAADMILDMIVILQNSGSLKVINSEEQFSVPSCMGGIAYEEGGSNLTFEYHYDDVSIVDMRWICSLVLKAIEVLYHTERWEALVHIAVQFNLITHERYSEQVTPILVHAQRMLAATVCHLNGLDATTPYLNKYMADRKGGKIHCRNYIGKQIHVAMISKKGINPGANIDPKGHIVYSAGIQGKALVCVPLDVMDTLACFRESMHKSKYSSRALRHSRKLLNLFLAHGQVVPVQEGMSNPYTTYGRVGFTAGAMQAHQPVPPDLSEEDFHAVYSIESKAIPPSQLSAVITSYEKTIDILHSNKQQGLKAQALHELGNLHLCTGNKRAAFKCWCQALDETLNMSDALNSWQELDSSPDSISNGRSKDYCEKFLCRAGIWGCLQSAVITAKMSRYIFTSNIRKRTGCCILSALLFKALFQVSLPHPNEDRDFALYEIGDECEISELIPGIDLFSDRYRADVNAVVSSLYFLMSELHSAAQNLMVLPLFTLYQYFVSMICRDPVRSIEGRLLKIKVLTDLHLFTEAFHELCLLIHGKRIPRRPHKGFIPVANTETIPKYSSFKAVVSKENLQAIEELLNRKPSTSLLSVGDQSTTHKLMLAKIHFILKLSSTINAVPELVRKSSYSVTVEVPKPQEKNSKAAKTEKTEQTNDEFLVIVQLTSQEHLTLPTLKGILLNEAEESLNSFLGNLQEKNNGQLLQCSAAELEMAVEAKLHISEIAQQRYQTALSVAMTYSVMRLLQEAKIFTRKRPQRSKNVSPALKPHGHGNEKKKEHRPTSADPRMPCDTEAREHLNISIWLRCRLALVTALRAQMAGVAIQEEEMIDGSAMITEGIVEAETFSDFETQAHLMLQGALLDIQEGRPKKGIRILLESVIHLLEEQRLISPAACLTFAQSLILLADLMEPESDHQQLFWMKQLDTLTLAHKLIIKQIASLGEAIEHHVIEHVSTSPLQPLRNIYLPHINLLAKVKLRIGVLLAQKTCSSTDLTMEPSQLLPSCNVLIMALELCRISSFREYDVEAELLFQKGKIERQMLVSGDKEKLLAVKSFAEAITVSCNYDHNFGLMRKSYLEIALVYFHMASIHTDKTSEVVPPKKETPKITKSKGKDKVKETEDVERTWRHTEYYQLLTWIAIRAATQVSKAMLACKELMGQETVTAQTLIPELHKNIPTFACMDLLANYKYFLTDDYQIKCEQDMSDRCPREEDDSYNLPKGMLSWIHLIRYYNHLLRLQNVINMTGFSKSEDGKQSAVDTLNTSLISNGVSLRVAEMHQFLKRHLFAFSNCCAHEFPQEILKGLEMPFIGFYTPCKTVSESKEFQQMKQTPAKISHSLTDNKAEVRNESMATTSLDRELCVQWYLPSLEKQSEPGNPMVMLLFAYNKMETNIKNPKNCDPDNLICGHLWIPLSRVVSLHEKLSVLNQKAEISLQPVMGSTITERSEKQKRSAQTAKSKTDPKQTQISEDLQEIIKQHCSEVQNLLSSVQDPQTLIKAPFDITLPSLIRLEKFFDLSHGCMLMKGSLLDWIALQLT